MKNFLLKDSNFSLQNVEQPMFVQFSSASVQFSSASFRTQFSPVRVQLVIKVSTSLLRKIKHLKIRNSLLFIFSSIEKIFPDKKFLGKRAPTLFLCAFSIPK